MPILLRLILVALALEIILSGVKGDLIGAEFINPPSAGPAGDFTHNLVWKVQESQRIQWNTLFSNYSIVLWQQMTPTMARRGPIILDYTCKTSNNSQIAEFGWTVQSYDLDQSESPVFFLRLVPSASNVVVISQYFNISTASSSVGALSSTGILLPDSTTTTPGSAIRRNLTSSSTFATIIIPTSIPGSTTTANASVIGSKITTNSTANFFLNPGSTTAAASPATLNPSVTTKTLPIMSSTVTYSIITSISSSSTPYTPQILKASSGQPAQLDSDSNADLIEVAVVLGTAGVAIAGLLIWWKVQKRKMLRLELQRRQQRVRWPRLTILNVCERRFSERAGTLGNEASEVFAGAREPVELESQRPVAEMPGV